MFDVKSRSGTKSGGLGNTLLRRLKERQSSKRGFFDCKYVAMWEAKLKPNMSDVLSTLKRVLLQTRS
ncbi:hypothetical protein HID58_081645 [Brassica napus]|uniref:Uncharacterized protein n=1 Tax=Brassica napus TaxID=3708 RepID=A0ABQ7Y9Q6_BRANA|nr:hypothetical protein HID58_081645 [Brassica napus]